MQSLSQINQTPIYTTTLPSTKEKVKYRPFLSKEERTLLTAKESDDVETMYSSLEAVVRSCLETKVKNLTTFDIEYLFVLIRAKSVSETSDILIKCSGCGEDTMNVINLETIQVQQQESHSTKLQLTDEIVLKMKYPSVEDVLTLATSGIDENVKTELALKCIEIVYHGENTYNLVDETEEEKTKFFASFRPQQTKILREFIDTIPTAQIVHTWTCPKCNKNNTNVLKGIFSFF